ncbi:MAG: phosphatidate cytidylyltransferase [Spirochaetes bacterium]|nr:phosphatidate cytidylyltransferase [Spirochaetota bacterium]MBU0956137.1 phosphatidate cytidylyltransferase [Spirochaetota bacterium]
MKNLLFRILLVVIALPLLISAALFLPMFNHAVLALIIILFSAGSALELIRIMSNGNVVGRVRFLTGLCIIAPGVLLHLAGLMVQPTALELFGFAALGFLGIGGLALLPLTFATPLEKLPAALERLKTFLFSLGYIYFPAMLLLIMLTSSVHVGYLVLWFCLIVFSNDSAAWLFGMTLGRHRGFLKVSPNKSIEGFIAGMAASIGAAILGNFWFQFTDKLLVVLLLGLFCGLTGIIGDLFESAIKRSFGVKDSGTSIPGRGGFLDSYDSIMFAVYPFFITLLVLDIL